MRRPLALVLVLATLAVPAAGADAHKKRLHPQPPRAGATLPEVEAWVAKAYPGVVFDPEGVPPEVWAAFFADFAELAPDLPRTVANLRYVGTGGARWDVGNGVNAVMLTSGHPGGPYFLCVNPRYCGSLAALKALVKENEAAGYYVKGASRGRPTRPFVAHELAHLLQRQLKATSRAKHDELMRIVAENDAAPVSKYAATNPEEAFAEAVAAWHAQEPSEFAPLTRAIGRELKALGIAR